MKDFMKYSGIYTALLTPFHQDGSVNRDVLRQMIDLNLSMGVKGFYACGSTAEALMLETSTRKEILETVVEAVNGRAAVFAHIGCISTDMALDLAVHAAEHGVDAISSIPPFYYSFSAEELYQYYGNLANATDVPLLIYNIPSMSGVTFTRETMNRLLSNPKIIGVKHTSKDFFMLSYIKEKFPDKVVFNGFDEMFISGIAAGADGAIGSTFNFMGDKYVRMYQLIRENRLKDALALQHEANHIIEELIEVGLMAGEKAIMGMLGLDMGPPRKPFLPLSAEAYNRLQNVFEENR